MILSKKEQNILATFAETLIPGEHIRESGLVQRLDDHLKYFSPDERLGFRLVLLLFNYGAFFYRARLRTFLGMDIEWRKRYLEAWHNSWLAAKRSLWRFLCGITFINYYSIPDVAIKVGYTPSFKPPKDVPRFKHENASITPLDHDVKEECDVCIIGSGAGGAVMAKTLAAAGRKVIILEEGGFFGAEDYGQDPVTMTKILYRNGGVINTFGWPAILVPIGKCVGGTTTINSGTCFRTPPKVLDRWSREFGLSTWSADRMAKYYEEVERTLCVAPASPLKKNAEVFKRGLDAMGLRGAPLMRNAPGCSGSGVCCFGCPTNAKKGTDVSYIPLALDAGARLYAHCQVSRFLYTGTHATTVIGRFRDPLSRKRMATIEVKAKAVVLSCGTFYSPTLLMRSHVPNVSGQIGHNLTLHPAAKVMALMNEEVHGWDEVPQGYYSDALAGEGIMLEEIFLSPAYVAPSLLHTQERHREVMKKYNNLAISGFMVSDTSHGRILRLPGGRPITIYNVNKADVAKYVKGIAVLAEAFFKAGATNVFLPLHTLPEITPDDGVKKIAERKIRAKDLDLQAFHPLGTCRMGADPSDAVCDPNGRVYGLDNVFIADGSIFPTSLGVNPMMTIMAAAAKIGGYIDREVL